MEGIYRKAELVKRSLFQRIFRQIPEENSVIEVNNLLASKPVRDISFNEMSDISTKYKVNILKTFKRNVYEFYAVYLNHCLRDKSLSADEFENLKHLKGLLNLNDKDVELIHNELAGAIYQKNVQEAVADGRLDDAEKAFLVKLQQELRLTESIAQKLSIEVRGKFLSDHLNKVVADQRLSPHEEDEFNAMANSLMIDVKHDDKTKDRLERFKLFWLIENGDLPVKEVDVNLQRSEECYFTASVDWYEQRTVTKRINYAGPTARIKIMKGVYYRVGSIQAQRVTREEWRLIDLGHLYLTNKRIIFMGSKKNSNIRLDKVLSFTPYSDGIQIDKETGRSPMLAVKGDIEVFSLLLSRLLRDA